MEAAQIQYIEKIFQDCAESQIFGKGFSIFVKFEIDERYKAENAYASSTLFVNATFKHNENESEITRAVVIKMVLDEQISVWSLVRDLLFGNETSVYRKIIPYFSRFDASILKLFPKFYYCSYVAGENSETYAIVMENLLPEGYSLARDKTFLDFDHLKLMVEKIGQYHAYSYVAKHTNEREFSKYARTFREVNPTVNDCVPGFIEPQFLRGLEPLRSDEKYKNRLNKVEKIYEDIAGYLVDAFSFRNGKTAVITHGDFTRHNVLFKYDSHMKPIDMKIFDFGCSRYNSPTADLSTILWLNADQETRNQYWTTLLDFYYNSVTKTYEKITKKAFNFPSKLEIFEEFEKTAILGYYYCSFFLPTMWREEQDPSFVFADAIATVTSDDPIEATNQLSQICLQSGGIEATKKLADVLRDIINRGFII